MKGEWGVGWFWVGVGTTRREVPRLLGPVGREDRDVYGVETTGLGPGSEVVESDPSIRLEN